MELPLHVVNVFTNKGIYGGNQLGVLPDAASLTTAEMQQIAKQMNYSESTFVTNMDEQSADVRIFLPNSEIPFAGHPTLGSAYLIEKLHQQNHLPRDKLRLDLQGGEVMTYFDHSGRVYMDQLSVTEYGMYDESERLLETLGLTPDQIISEEFPIIAPSSLKFIFVPVKTIDAISQIKVNFEGLQELLEGTDMEPYVFAPHGMDGGDIYARFFAPNSGIIEDPATGSAQASLIRALEVLKLLPEKDEIIVEQGYDMGRPSTLYNRIMDRDTLEVKTGGYVSHILEGMIHL